MAWLGLLAVWLWALAGPSRGAPPEESAEELAALVVEDIEDPRLLGRLGQRALAVGDEALATRFLTARVERLEVKKYLPFREGLQEALVLEAIGQDEAAAARYRAAVHDDPLRAVLVLRILSVHPERDALVEEIYAHVRGLADRAREGARDALIYVTTKGEPRYLTPTTTAAVVQEARRGGFSRYCYLEELDLTSIRGPMPERIALDRCVIGRIRGSAKQYRELVLLRSFVLGDAVFGKAFESEVHKSATVPPSRFEEVSFRETVFMGTAGFDAIEVGPGRGYFPMVVFEGPAGFKGAEFAGVTEFRFASFGRGANFRFMRMYQPVYFGGTRYRADTVFSHVYSDRDVYFNEARFDAALDMDHCEFQRGATFEGSRFHGPATFATSVIDGTLNLSRAVFEEPVDVREVELGGLDALGTHFRDHAFFNNAAITGRTRFSLDHVTRRQGLDDLDSLLPLYRHYQGDEDADEPETDRSSYGVESVEDLSSVIDGDISFANTRFGGFTVFEGVRFGQPDRASLASFYNAQFDGETHFEGARWYATADFTTIYGREVAFNRAVFYDSLLLDDANVEGRVTLTDARFARGADLSFYGAEISSFQISPAQVEGDDRPHRLFYEACARGEIDRDDLRVRRILDEGVPEERLRAVCYGYVVDEFVALKDSYGERAMTGAEDDAYWWSRHYDAVATLWHGRPASRVWGLVQLVLFELCFGWGVQLGNLGVTSAGVTVLFAWLYRVYCPDTMLVFDGREMPVREVSFVGLCFVSLQSLIAINTGWDFGDDDHAFRYLNTIETLIGFVILTFFVGAYTRMILAA